MREIERKILGIDKEKLVQDLIALGAVKDFSGLVRVKYFDTSDRKIRQKHDLLRVREFMGEGNPPFTEIVYKSFCGIKGGCKHIEETELKLSGQDKFGILCDLLKKLGFDETAFYEKKREQYSYKLFHFEIDTYPGIPTFLEIEGPTPSDIDKMVGLLKLEKHEQTPESISSLISRKYPGLNLKNLKFKGSQII